MYGRYNERLSPNLNRQRRNHANPLNQKPLSRRRLNLLRSIIGRRWRKKRWRMISTMPWTRCYQEGQQIHLSNWLHLAGRDLRQCPDLQHHQKKAEPRIKPTDRYSGVQNQNRDWRMSGRNRGR
jgi:hypothetical protein